MSSPLPSSASLRGLLLVACVLVLALSLLCPVSGLSYGLQATSSVVSPSQSSLSIPLPIVADNAGHLWSAAALSSGATEVYSYSIAANGSLSLAARYSLGGSSAASVSALTMDAAGAFYVSSYDGIGDSAITHFSSSGSILAQFAAAGVQLPMDLAVSPASGALYVADEGSSSHGGSLGYNSGVDVFTAAGARLGSVFGQGANALGGYVNSTEGVAFSPSSTTPTIYFSDTTNCRILQSTATSSAALAFSTFSTLINLTASAPSLGCSASFPVSDLTVDASGVVWAVVNSNVVAIFPNGTLALELNVSALTVNYQSILATNVAVDSALNVYVAAYGRLTGGDSQVNNYVLRFTPLTNQAYSSTSGPLPPTFHSSTTLYLAAVASAISNGPLVADASGHLYGVGTYLQYLAQYSLLSNGSIALVRQSALAPATNPAGLAVDAAGDVIAVAVNLNAQIVERFSPSGTLLASFTPASTSNLLGVAVSPVTGNYYVADAGGTAGSQNGVSIFTPSGTRVGTLSGSAAIPLALTTPPEAWPWTLRATCTSPTSTTAAC